MRRVLPFVFFLLSWFGSLSPAHAGEMVVVLSQKSAGYGRIASLLEQHANQKQWNLQITDAEKLLKIENKSVQLYVPIGSLATQAVLSHRAQQPVLAIMITRSAYEALQQSGSKKFSAILLDQPAERILALAKLLLPNAGRLGFLAGDKTDSVAIQYQQAANDMSIESTTAHIEEEGRAAVAINFLLDESEGIVALPDAMVMKPNTAKWLLYMAYQEKLPVISFSRAYVKAGALAAAYSTPEDLARQAIEWLDSHFQKNDTVKSECFFPKYFQVSVNNWVARSLRINNPNNEILIQQVDELSREPKQ